MSLKVKDTGGSFEVCPEGSYISRCFAVIDLGEQASEFYKNISPKVYVGWEIPDKKMSDGKPMIVYQKYTASIGKKARLRALLEQWRGRAFTKEELEGFALKNIIGVAGYITINNREGSDNKIYANVAGVSTLPPGIQCPPLVNRKIYFDLDNYTDESYNSVPQGFRDKINLSNQMSAENERKNQQSDDNFDDIPF